MRHSCTNVIFREIGESGIIDYLFSSSMCFLPLSRIVCIECRVSIGLEKSSGPTARRRIHTQIALAASGIVMTTKKSSGSAAFYFIHKITRHLHDSNMRPFREEIQFLRISRVRPLHQDAT